MAPKQKLCACGCGEPCAKKFKRGHYMRTVNKLKLHEQAVRNGRIGGLKRAKALSAARRREIAHDAGKARQRAHKAA